ncbi:MAG TPA: heat-inducible transcriptional repressor HrcA [Acidimicrobiia bacterium]|jgi:heat-inducible transcriptional repressor
MSAMDPADRRAAVLRAIVEEYVVSAQPVASQTVARSSALGVSSATVRNDMTQLERDGYIVQPHTSAGRIPTDQGYRYFVDHFTSAETLPVGQRRAVLEFFTSTNDALGDLLHETSQLLARITSHAAVIVGPQSDAAKVRSLQLVSLQPTLVMVVVVLANGVIEKETLTLEEPIAEQHLQHATKVLDTALHNATLATAGRVTLAPTGVPRVDRVAEETLGLLARRGAAASEPLYVGGASRLAAEHEAFATAQTAARLLQLLEEQVVVVALVRDLLEHGVTVSIGEENDVDALRDCSLVLAPYNVEGQVAGTVGVLGPTRMDYQQALAAVAAVSQQLGRLLRA